MATPLIVVVGGCGVVGMTDAARFVGATPVDGIADARFVVWMPVGTADTRLVAATADGTADAGFVAVTPDVPMDGTVRVVCAAYDATRDARLAFMVGILASTAGLNGTMTGLDGDSVV